VTVEILESRLIARTVLAVVLVLEGEPRVGMILRGAHGQDWEMRGFAFVPPQALADGRQGIMLAPRGHNQALHTGERLHAA
jgi:hypothetical protein